MVYTRIIYKQDHTDVSFVWIPKNVGTSISEHLGKYGGREFLMIEKVEKERIINYTISFTK